MGWSNSSLAINIWRVVRPCVKAADRQRLARRIIEFFEDEDCDVLYEAEQLVKDAGEDWFDRR